MFIDTEFEVKYPGVIFGYRANMSRADAVLILQVWRPVSSTQRLRLQLIDVMSYSTGDIGDVEVSHNSHISL